MKILIIGATSSVGSEMCRLLADQSLYLTGSTNKSLISLKENMSDVNEDYLFLKLDLCNAESVDSFLSEANSISYDWVIFCAGDISADDRNLMEDVHYVKNLFEINILNFIYLVGKLEKNIVPGGGIVALSSTASLFGNGFYPVYSATKAALNGFILSIKRYFEESDKYAFSVCMGPTNTKMRQRISDNNLIQQQPILVAELIKNIINKPLEFNSAAYLVVKDSKYFRVPYAEMVEI